MYVGPLRVGSSKQKLLATLAVGTREACIPASAVKNKLRIPRTGLKSSRLQLWKDSKSRSPKSEL